MVVTQNITNTTTITASDTTTNNFNQVYTKGTSSDIASLTSTSSSTTTTTTNHKNTSSHDIVDSKTISGGEDIVFNNNNNNDDDDDEGSNNNGHNNVDSIVLPQHIQIYLEDVLLRTTTTTPELSHLHITDISTFRSAQQQLYLIKLGHHNQDPNHHTIVTSHHSSSSSSSRRSCCTNDSFLIYDAIRQGNDYIVIKIWMGTSRWWNCHHTTIHTSPTIQEENAATNHSLRQHQQQFIAQQEMIGYDTAYKIFSSLSSSSIKLTECSVPSNNNNNNNNDTMFYTPTHTTRDNSNSIIRIPRVLYSSITDSSPTTITTPNSSCESPPPWCILEYVGPYSIQIPHKNNNYEKMIQQYDTSYIDAMITTRMEYGYIETHLRWGRLPIDLCIPYTLEVLNTFIIPLHIHYYTRYYLQESTSTTIIDDSKKQQLPTDAMNIYYFDTMIELLQSKYTDYIVPNIPVTSENDTKYTTILNEASQILKTAIDTIYCDEVLSSSSSSSSIRNIIPPVLCHMDLQPQNLIFATSSSSSSSSSSSYESLPPLLRKNDDQHQQCCPKLISVLDWEEAAYADPRFELLLLCRKVCANREQAEYIWQYYTNTVNEQLNLNNFDSTNHHYHHQLIQLGSITPWLKLESIHSITTILLECVAGGGRGGGSFNFHHLNNSNDETTAKSNASNIDNKFCCNTTIVAKLQREIYRLYNLGYTFSKTDHWCIVD